MKTSSGKSAKPRQRFAQHFLHDQSIIQRIIEALDLVDSSTVVEIGPGRGALTLPLLESLPKLVVIEIDRDLANHLRQTTEHTDKLNLYNVNALKFDFTREVGGRIQVVGNLPYNISTPLLFHLLDHIKCIDQMLLMLQKEVADRICATPGSREYGRLTIMVQSVCEVQQLFNVGPGSFTPQPKVESSVIKLLPRSKGNLNISDPQLLKNIVRAAFSKRRKTIRNALKGLVKESDILAIGIVPETRPEQISVESFVNLANFVMQK